MAITYFGRTAVPADGAAATNATTTINFTPPASMTTGDLVVVYLQQRGTATFSNTTSGGQSWSSFTRRTTTNIAVQGFWCRFDGTWDANPIFTFSAATCTSGIMVVYRPTDTGKFWALDVNETSSTFAAPTTPFTVTRAGLTATQSSTVSIAGWFTADDNTWGSISGTGWTVTGDAQYRNTAGSDQSMTFAHKIQGSGATGSVSKNQLTLGGDAGLTTIVTFYEFTPPTLFPKQIVTNHVIDTTLEIAFTGVTAGAKLVVSLSQMDDGATFPDPSGYTSTAGLTWTKAVDSGTTASTGNCEIWETVYPAGGSETVVWTWPDGTTGVNDESLQGVGYELTGQETSPGGATAVATLQTAPSLGITTTRDNSIVIGVVSDWSATDGASRVIRNGATETYYFFTTGKNTGYHFYKIVPTAGAAGSFGYSAPTGQASSIVLYEVRVSAGGSMTASVGAFTLTGNAANLLEGKKIVASSGSLTLTGNAANLLEAKRMTASAGSFTLTGYDSNLLEAKKITASTGTFILTGNTANLGRASILTADSASFVLTGQDIATRRSYVMPAVKGTYTLTGNVTNFLRGRVLPLTVGSYTLTGNAANLLEGKKLVADSLSLTFTGLSASLSKQSGTFYYIDPTGNDTTGTGSLGNPWKTLRKACTTVTTSGSTILVNAGTYTETASTISLSPGVNITGAGDTSIIRSSLTSTFTALLSLTSSEGTNGNQRISYLKFDGQSLSTFWAIAVRGRSNVEIDHCTVENFKDRGVIFAGRNDGGASDAPPSIYATGNSFHDNVVNNCAAYNTSQGVYGRGCLCIGGQDGMLVYGNTITQNQRPNGFNGWCIKYENGGYNYNVKIYNNVITKIPYGGTYPGENGWDFAIELWATRSGCEIYNNEIIGGAIDIDNAQDDLSTGYGIWIHDNIIYNTTSNSNYEDGIILETEQLNTIVENNVIYNKTAAITVTTRYGTAVNNIIVRRNLCYNLGRIANGNDGKGFVMGFDNTAGNTIANVYVDNNTFIGGTGIAPFYGYRVDGNGIGTLSGLYVRNNIFQNFQTSGINNDMNTSTSTGWVQNNNIIGCGNSNNPQTMAVSQTVSGNIKVTPGFVNASAGDYTLLSTSSLINAGLDIGLPFVGSAPDIGYAEFSTNIMTASRGTFTLTGNDVNLLEAKTMTASAGSLTLTGQAATFRTGKSLTASAGSFTFSGNTVLFHQTLIATHGSFTLVGNDATLTKANLSTLVASSGTFNLTGFDIALSKTNLLTASAGTFVLTGNDSILFKGGRMITCATGAYTLIGNDIITDVVILDSGRPTVRVSGWPFKRGYGTTKLK